MPNKRTTESTDWTGDRGFQPTTGKRTNPKTSALAALGLLVTIVVLTGCAGSTRGLPLYHGAAFEDGDTSQQLRVQYLRAGGLLLRRGSDAVLTAPFFSNPGVLHVGFWPISPDRERIDRHLPRVNDVQAILVGHAHYDHAMDLPYIVSRYATNAVVYGNNTLSNILSVAIPPCRLLGLDDLAGEFCSEGNAGTWLTSRNGKVRWMALKSEHAPHFAGVTLFGGEVTEKPRRLPRTAWGWKEGKTLAYVIDFLNPTNGIDYRVLYQDTAVNSPPFGALPAVLQDQKRIDVQVLCMASFQQVHNYPRGAVITPKPRYIIVGHWEDFFTSPEAELRVVRLTNGRRFMKRLREVFPAQETFLPVPGAWMVFENERKSSSAEENSVGGRKPCCDAF
jgi:hypothetical protein